MTAIGLFGFQNPRSDQPMFWTLMATCREKTRHIANMARAARNVARLEFQGSRTPES